MVIFHSYVSLPEGMPNTVSEGNTGPEVIGTAEEKLFRSRIVFHRAYLYIYISFD